MSMDFRKDPTDCTFFILTLFFLKRNENKFEEKKANRFQI